MAYRRRSMKMKRRRPYKKYVPKLSRGVFQRTNALTCTRKFVLGTAGSTVAGGWTTFPYSFRFDDIPSYSEFQSLFDSYRINAVKLQFTPFWDGNDTSQQFGLSTVVLPRVYTLIDRNGIPPGQINTEDKMLEYSKARQIKNPQKPFAIYIKYPGVELSSAGSITSSPAVHKARPWIDTSNTTIPHNGCAMGMIVPGGTPTSSFQYHVVATFYLQFKTVV